MIILGTVQFGLNYGINNNYGKPAVEQIFEILELAAANGIKIIDTADAYGSAPEILGEFNKIHPDTFYINTKFKAGQLPIRQQLERSLELLKVNSINTYFFHSFQDLKNFPGLLSDLQLYKERGLITKTGVSVYGNDEFETVVNTTEIDVIQIPFNLLDNRFQRGNLMTLAKDKDKELQIRSVFLQGLFFKPLADIPAKLTGLKPYLKEVTDLAHESHLSMENLALMYAFRQPEIDHVIIGVDNSDQLQKNLMAVKRSISSELVEKINQIAVFETHLLDPRNWN